MALNLSTLTSPATSGDVLAEALTTADFLEGVPVLRNLARGSQKGGDAKQDVALNQPKALPLIDGKGYLYVPDVVSNTCSTPDDSSIDITGDITIDIDLTLKNWNDGTERNLVSKYLTSSDQRSYRLFMTTTNRLSFVISSSGVFESGGSKTPTATISFPDNQRAQIRVQWRSSDGRVQFFTSTDKGQTFTQLGTDLFTSGITSIYNGTANLDIAHRTSVNRLANSAIHSVQIYDSVTPSSSSLRFNCDFTATNVRHGATKFKCATGQVVTINQSGNDPATIIKKPVLRFDGANSGLEGLFANNIDGGYMFAAFSVLGDGGDFWGRVFTVNKTGGFDYSTTGNIFSSRNSTSKDLAYASVTGNVTVHPDLFDDANGDILHQVKVTNSAQSSLVNGADFQSKTASLALEAREFNIGKDEDITENAAIDLEFLALFSADSVPDEATASKIRDYINKRNQIYLRHQTDGFYFFNPQKLAAGDVTSWNGNITGSDLGDTDVATNVTIVQGSQTSQPNADGYSLTFEDNTQHLEWASAYTPNFPAGQTKAWQIVGTSLGTFAYLTQGSVTELNLLGNLGNVSYRKAGDLYGVILLPESATGREINEAKKLLTDRGASVSATAVVTTAWRGRSDIVQFDGNMSDVTYATAAWRFCSSLESFSSNLPEATNVSFAWNSCTSLSDFRTTDIKNCTDFTSAWQSCSALTSFPAGAKLGTAAENVNFQRAWESSGLTSFSTPLPTANDLFKAWNGCTSLESFSAPLTSATLINYAWNGCTSLNRFNSQLSSVVLANNAWQNCSSLTDFTTTDIKNCTNFTSAWQNCSALQSFPAGAKLGTEATGYVNFTDAWRSSGLTSFNTPLTTAVNVTSAWRDNLSLTSFSTPLPSATDITVSWYNCTALTDFSADVFATWNPSSITSGVFNLAWVNCPLTAQSVENILTSIDSSGHFATTNKVSGGTPIADAGIDIDYDGTTLSAATNAAVTSLKSKGWSIIVNNVTL